MDKRRFWTATAGVLLAGGMLMTLNQGVAYSKPLLGITLTPVIEEPTLEPTPAPLEPTSIPTSEPTAGPTEGPRPGDPEILIPQTGVDLGGANFGAALLGGGLIVAALGLGGLGLRRPEENDLDE